MRFDDDMSTSGLKAYVPSDTCGGGLCYKFIGIEYAPNTGKIYLAPSFVTSVIIVDPVHNVMDASAMADVSTNRRCEACSRAPSTAGLRLFILLF